MERDEDILVRDCLGTRPFNIKVAELSSHHRLATCLIAESLPQDFFVTAETSLCRQETSWELTFMIVRHSIRKDVAPTPMYRSRDARPYIPEGRRPQVIELACDSLETLLRNFGAPRRIIRVLKEPHKASLRLHDDITNLLAGWGYRKSALSAATAHYIWVHERRA